MIMKKRTKIVVIAFAAAAVIGTGAGVGVATMGDDDTPITGEALDHASRAALDHVGEGRVTDTEAGDEEGAYEVEVTKADGSQVDVHLDADFNVIGTEADTDEADDEGDNDGD